MSRLCLRSNLCNQASRLRMLSARVTQRKKTVAGQDAIRRSGSAASPVRSVAVFTEQSRYPR